MLEAELNGHICGSSEDQDADRNVDSKDCAHEVSYGKAESTKN